jgi:hypothetical protein
MHPAARAVGWKTAGIANDLIARLNAGYAAADRVHAKSVVAVRAVAGLVRTAPSASRRPSCSMWRSASSARRSTALISSPVSSRSSSSRITCCW